ncbi:hypothetical protein WJX73_003991 [Symbiochloris irregularis]|uniref:Uncharacterized protein n=1 Tax=Symbiochloris irregularis TaxID=706552 RepID=A0AAW1NLE3_9CHLO
MFFAHNKAVKAAGAPQAALPAAAARHSQGRLHTAISVERLFPGSTNLSTRSQGALRSLEAGSSSSPAGPTFASQPDLHHHQKLTT